MYAEAMIVAAISGGTNGAGSGEEGSMDWEKNGQNPNESLEEDAFVRMLIKGGKVGFETKKVQTPTMSAAQQQ